MTSALLPPGAVTTLIIDPGLQPANKAKDSKFRFFIWIRGKDTFFSTELRKDMG